jgi:hypothetical protein
MSTALRSRRAIELVIALAALAVLADVETPLFPKRVAALIRAMRTDLGQGDLRLRIDEQSDEGEDEEEDEKDD